MSHTTILWVVVVSLTGVFVDQAWARGRSFPIAVTGTITTFEKKTQTFVLEADEPPAALTIAVGRDCKFIQSGAPAGERILTKGARVRVKYFSTIFTGKIAVEIESNPAPEIRIGVIKRIDWPNRKLYIQVNGLSSHCVVRWAGTARFMKRGRKALPTDLQENARVRVSYYSPPFESKYAVKIEWAPDP